MTTFGEWFEQRDHAIRLAGPRRHPGLVCLLVSLPFQFLAVSLVTGAHVWPVLANSALASLAVFILNIDLCMRATERRMSAVKALHDTPAEFEQHAVELSFWCGPLDYGVDAGVVSIVDSWLVYEGLSTRFAVQYGVDVEAKLMGDSQFSWLISCRANGRRFSVLMSPRVAYQERIAKYLETAESFSTAMTRWTLIDYGSGSAVLPVMKPQPILRERSKRTRRICAMLVIPALVLACLAWYLGGLALCALIAPFVETVLYLLMSSTLWLEQADEMDAGKTPKRRSVLTARTFGGSVRSPESP